MKNFTLSRAMILIGLLLSSHLLIGQSGNYFAGFQSGTGNTGTGNAFVGYQSGVSYNTGWYNTFLGHQSGFLNREGSYNTFIGSFAGYDNTSGRANTFVGWAAGSNNTTAISNSFFGNLAGYQTSTGGNNSFYGSGAGRDNTTGTNNAFFGERAGLKSTASNNTFIGKSAGENTTTGGVNTFVGSEAGFNNTNGYNNVFMGRNAGQNNTSGRENTFLGRSAGFNNTTGYGNAALGYLAGPSTGTLTNATAIGNKARVTASNSLVLGSINGVNGATADTKVGIRTTAPGYNLHVNGTAAKPGGGSWTVASDKNLKQEVEPYKEGLQQVIEIQPVWFRYNGKAGLPTEKKYVGVIAQEMQKVAPHTIGEFIYEDSTGKQEKYLDYDANALTYMLVNAVKELKTENEQKNTQIEQLQQELAEIKQLLGNLIPGNNNSVARLDQNEPNPYGSSTIIRYFVPQTATAAQLKVYSITGQEVYSKELIKGQGEVEISNQILAAGTYIYHLIVDGSRIDNKKMILTR